MCIFIVEHKVYNYVVEYIESIIYVLPQSTCHVYRGIDDVINIINQNAGPYVFIKNVPYGFERDNIYVLNIEQLTKTNEYAVICSISKNICDYSLGNIKLLPNDKKVYYLPYQYNPSEDYAIEKDSDVVFIGWATGDRRMGIINRIPNIRIIENSYGTERDTLLFRHKILVNVHFDKTYNIHEQIRTTRCIFNKMIVITEPSVDDDTHPLRNHMIIVEYEDIHETVLKVLKNYDKYYNKLFNTPEFEKIKEELTIPLLDFQAECV